MYKEALKNLGLSENEIAVYVSLLEIGISKVDSIAKRAAFPRTTTYCLLNLLLNKGLVSYVIKSGVKYYESTSPERLLIKEKERLEELKNAIPELSALVKSVGEKPTIEMYEGKEGLKSIYEDLLKTKDKIFGYGNTKLLFEMLEFYIPNYIKRRARLNIPFLVITEKSDSSIAMQKNDKKENRRTRFIDEMKNTSNVVYIYDNKIAIIGLIKKQPIGVIIQNEGFYNSQKIVFNILWKLAKP